MISTKTEKNSIHASSWAAVLISAFVAGLLTVMGIYWIESYGMALFVLIPFFIGLSSTTIYGYRVGITTGKAWSLGLTTLAIYSFGLMLFAIEGLICIIMSLPLAIPIAILGSLAGQALIKKTLTGAPGATLLLLFLIPLTGFAEKGMPPKLTSVTTSVEIDASPETVWKNVVEFPQLDEPEEFIFKTGIAYHVAPTELKKHHLLFL